MFASTSAFCELDVFCSVTLHHLALHVYGDSETRRAQPVAGRDASGLGYIGVNGRGVAFQRARRQLRVQMDGWGLLRHGGPDPRRRSAP